MSSEDLIFRLRERAKIRRQIPTRKSVQNNEPDRISDILEEAANKIEELDSIIHTLDIHCSSLECELSYSLANNAGRRNGNSLVS